MINKLIKHQKNSPVNFLIDQNLINISDLLTSLTSLICTFPDY